MTVDTAPPCVDVRPMWGTMIRIDVRDHVHGARTVDALDDVWSWFQRVDDLFSTWRADSEISRLARGEIDLGETSAEVAVVLDRCEEMNRVSRGAFDIAFAAAPDAPERPGRCAVDPTGLVKGWAVDRAGDLLRAHGLAHFAINAGGDILVRGRPHPGGLWRVGVQHPWQRDHAAAIVGLTDSAIATSGAYERGDHVVDPRSGRPARGLASVSVIASELARADGYATAALALGTDGMSWLATRPDAVAIGITDDHRVVKTIGFDEFVLS